MRTKCPLCNQHYEIEDQYLNQSIECPKCKETFVIQPIEEKEMNKPEGEFREQSASNDQTPQGEKQGASNKKRKRKLLFITCLFVFLISCIGIYYYNYKKNLKCTISSEENNKDIMKKALLDLAKYPGSSEVVFEHYNDFPFASFVAADGYIDMANGFGVKSRYKFSFHVKKYVTVKPYFFSLFGGQKFIWDKKDLGQINLKDPQGQDHFIQSEELWR